MVAVEDAIAFIDALIFKHKGRHLDELQSTILRQSWHGNRYMDIADIYGCTEGHAKDMGAQLWQFLSTILGEKITKRNFQTSFKRYLREAIAQDEAHLLVNDQYLSASLAESLTASLTKPLIVSSQINLSNPHFIGRDGAIADLDHLVSLGTKVILIQAQGGVGKTTLARQYLQHRFDKVLEFAIAKETNNITSIEGLIEERLQQLDLEPGREFGISLDRLKHKLAQEPIGILIDNLEPVLDRNGKFISPHRSYVEFLVTLATPGLKSLTLITSRDRLSESAVKLRRYLLPGLELAAWQYYFATHLPDLLPFSQSPSQLTTVNQVPHRDRLAANPELSVTSANPANPNANINANPGTNPGANIDIETESSINLDSQSLATIAKIHQAYGGNAKAMDILCSAIANDFDGDIVAYWQEFQADPLAQRDLANLVTSQFNRLQTLDPTAYNLLCRLGCYRYQDVSTIPSGAILALLWDAPENQPNQPNQQRRLIESLRDRSLIEHHKGSYWLHPIIRAEAIARLRNADLTDVAAETNNINNKNNKSNLRAKLETNAKTDTEPNARKGSQTNSDRPFPNSSDRSANPETATELELANRAAAKFWTESTSTIDTVEDALRCFEAYYHYLAINDYEAAAAVILQRRQTKSTGIERLGRTFYKLGLLQQMIVAIANIVDKIHSAYHLSGLYGILGVLYRLSGKIHAAIDCHQRSGEIAKQHLSLIANSQPAGSATTFTTDRQPKHQQTDRLNHPDQTDHQFPDHKFTNLRDQASPSHQSDRGSLNHLEVLNLKNWRQHALLNIGICQIELWELEAARQTFTQLNTHNRHQLIAENLEELYNPSVDVFSAFVHSCLSDRPTALKFAQAFDRKLSQNPSLGTGHRLLFLGLTYKNLGEIEPALKMLNRAIDYANQHHYTQVKANATSGLAELDRCQQHYQAALAHHQIAIDLLAQIGTKCDLAEAYYQLGNTYQAIKESKPSQASYNQAIKLFQEMQAPRQIEKVQRANALLTN
jgi:tetratricopeptide (TPR) repeat protein